MMLNIVKNMFGISDVALSGLPHKTKFIHWVLPNANDKALSGLCKIKY